MVDVIISRFVDEQLRCVLPEEMYSEIANRKSSVDIKIIDDFIDMAIDPFVVFRRLGKEDDFARYLRDVIWYYYGRFSLQDILKELAESGEISSYTYTTSDFFEYTNLSRDIDIYIVTRDTDVYYWIVDSPHLEKPIVFRVGSMEDSLYFIDALRKILITGCEHVNVIIVHTGVERYVENEKGEIISDSAEEFITNNLEFIDGRLHCKHCGKELEAFSIFEHGY